MNATCFLFIKFRISITIYIPLSNKKIAQSKNSILLDVDGMKCGSCVQAVEKILKSHPNINNASVNLVTKTAFIEIKEPNNSL